MLVLAAWKGSLVWPTASAEDTQFDYFNKKLEALYPWAPLINSGKVKIASNYRGAFPFEVFDPQNLLRSHPEPLQGDIYGLLKPGQEGLRQPVREDQYEGKRENSQEPTQKDPFKELQRPVNLDHFQTGKDGLPKLIRNGVVEPVNEELRQGKVWALERVMWACHQLFQYFDDHLTQMNFDAVVGTRIAEGEISFVFFLFRCLSYPVPPLSPTIDIFTFFPTSTY